MRIGGLSGYGAMSGISPYNTSKYSVSSVHGNPKSLQPVSEINENSQSAKPFAILSKEQEAAGKEAKKIAEKQTMTAAKDYDQVMQQMMSARKVNITNPAEDVMSKAKSGQVDVAVIDKPENKNDFIDQLSSAFANQIGNSTSDNANNNQSNNESLGVVSFQMQRALNAYSDAFAMGNAI